MQNNFDREMSALDFNFGISTRTCEANKNVSLPWERSFFDGLLTNGDSSMNVAEYLKIARKPLPLKLYFLFYVATDINIFYIIF